MGFTEYTMNYEGELALELLFRHEGHLYYLHIMLLVYFFLPVTRRIAARADQRLLEYDLAAYHPCPRRSVSALVLPAGFLLAFGGTWAASAAAGKPDGPFLEGMGVGMLLVALGEWGLCRTISLPERAGRLKVRFSNASFCVYLTHVVFLQAFARHGIRAVGGPYF